MTVRQSSRRPVRALVIDDSALFRKLITELLQADGSIEVVDTANDPLIARQKIKALNPDVLTLDVEMDEMDGITFLRNLMRLRPMPVVMVSSLTGRGADVTLEALALGAVDFVTKPKLDIQEGFRRQGMELRQKVIAASQTRPLRIDAQQVARAAARPAGALGFKTTDQLIAVGASTGGTEAVREFLGALPGDAPGVVITQHIPASFSEPFAMRLDAHCALSVHQASDGDPILPGHAYVAPGGEHLEVERTGTRFRCRVHSGPAVQHHRPSVDVLFRSVAAHLGHNATGVLLTGMGADGAQGMLAMRHAGAHTICQDEASSIVWGMPGAAVKLGAACEVAPLAEIAGKVLEQLRSTRASAA